MSPSVFCGMVDYCTMARPEQESDGCHFGTSAPLGKFDYRPKTKWPPGDYIAHHKYPTTCLILVLEC